MEFRHVISRVMVHLSLYLHVVFRLCVIVDVYHKIEVAVFGVSEALESGHFC
jgi:hypothetical protein